MSVPHLVSCRPFDSHYHPVENREVFALFTQSKFWTSKFIQKAFICQHTLKSTVLLCVDEKGDEAQLSSTSGESWWRVFGRYRLLWKPASFRWARKMTNFFSALHKNSAIAVNHLTICYLMLCEITMLLSELLYFMKQAMLDVREVW